MTSENKQKYDAKLKRIYDAVALREPDMIPATPSAELFPVFNAGYTVAEVVYDATMEKMKHALVKYVTDFDPDVHPGLCNILAGEGPGLELTEPNNLRWAGMPGNPIDENSLQQHIEFPTLLDEEFEEFKTDRTGWTMRKQMPRTSNLLKPMAMLAGGFGSDARGLARIFSMPDFQRMIGQFKKINDFYTEHDKRAAEVVKYVEELGYPNIRTGMAGAPFDSYSNGMRGTILSLSDLYDDPDFVLARVEENYERMVQMIRMGKGSGNEFVFMPLHKGMDGFMSAEHYRKFYWKYLQGVILEIIDAGKTPYVYTEGKYNSRLDFLTEVPPGKVVYHFEDVDMAVAKKKLGGIACITGGYQPWKLGWQTREQVRDEIKRLIDICAPGGGYMFETSCGLDYAKRENVEVMFDTVRSYGKA
ncbi:MAG: hypothetical protein IKP17_09170 [Oscillospiraceae bacterium]|nr:hypothetical protein [Oscillospiraceae bacterium]